MSTKAATARPVRELLSWSRSLTDPALRAAVRGMPESMALVAGYHFGWLDAHGNPARGDGGKAIRPALVLLAATAAGGSPERAVPASVAVELIHNYSLLHDDVMDGDETRRHRPTAWTVFGRSGAILAGDALQVLAFDVLAASGHRAAPDSMRMLSGAVLQLLDGQAADLAFERQDQVSVTQCVEMALAKTGALLGCACAIGALTGGAPPEQVQRMRRFGELLGLAFQHVDDLLGIWGDPELTGKPVYNDLASRKKSLPVVKALNSGTGAGLELAERYAAPGPLDLRRAAELVDEAGGRLWSQAEADRLLAEALVEIGPATSEGGTAAELISLAKLATHRDH
ncbi:family 2 encapsulin nanocompartment cargo protein polyprenyl transferase [Longispora albida]|uniref:family 2 encapsulin nanocompartment cargo protein polyprenyl transferase n=1 Tax=Longispora albida TaxID=203523 RepID=UPI000381B229|nr:family 2 encapsulin nanocompartment cargo protein polyprenyl transferase [Longispora albida]